MGIVIGKRELDLGIPSMNWYARLLSACQSCEKGAPGLAATHHNRSRNGNAQSIINPKYVPFPPCWTMRRLRAMPSTNTA